MCSSLTTAVHRPAPVIIYPTTVHHRSMVIDVGSNSFNKTFSVMCRSMINVGRKSCDQTTTGFEFSVMSCNVLSDMNVKLRPNLYKHCPGWALDWGYRLRLLLQQIWVQDPDIICLQEVQNNHLVGLSQALSLCGYSVVYKEKAGREYTRKNVYISEGCATFYRNSMFKAIETYEIEFGKMAASVIEAMDPSLSSAAKPRLIKDNVALVVKLQPLIAGCPDISPKSKILVANAHIQSNPKLADVKLLQVSQLVHKVEEVCGSKIPVIISGDFNSLPGSDAHVFLTQGRIESPKETHADVLGIYRLLNLRHSLSLASAYSSLCDAYGVDAKQLCKMDCDTREPLFTHARSRFSSTLDYIFYTENNLTVESLLEPVDRGSLSLGLPSPHWSSDHIALMAKFSLNFDRFS